MDDYLLTKVDVSPDEEFQDDKIIDPITQANLDFINDDDSNVDDVNFYCSTNEKLALGDKDKTPLSVLKHNVGKLKMDSDSESEYEEEEEQFAIPNSEHAEFPEETKIIIPERMRSFHGTDNYEWNHYKLPEGEVYKFPRVEKYMKLFLDSLFMAIKDNASINKFLTLPQNYVGKFEDPHEIEDDPLAGEDDTKKAEQSKDCLYLNLLYAIRHASRGEYFHTTDFSCLDEQMLKELEGIKKVLEFDRVNARFEDKVHLVNDILISYGFFSKSYVIQKKTYYLNLGDQEKLKRKCDLTSCVSK